MKLLSFEFLPRGPDGWGSRELSFGDQITQVYGRNGSGKTPLINGIMYALGNPYKFRQDILDMCESVRLNAKVQDQDLSFIRRLSSDFDLEVAIPESGDTLHFDSEEEFSSFLFEALDIEIPELISLQGKKSAPYISTYLPVVFANQKTGYQSLYSPRGPSFLRDQRIEMLRLAFGIPAKNPFDKKVAKRKLEDSLRAIDKKVLSQKNLLDSLREKMDLGDQKSLLRERSLIEEQLGDLRKSIDLGKSGVTEIETLIRDKKESIQGLRKELSDVEAIKRSRSRIAKDIDAEVSTLNLNVVAADAFRESLDICDRENCGLFILDKMNFGKGLLYLKDQQKDLDNVIESLDLEIIRLNRAIIREQTAVQELADERTELLQSSELAPRIEVVENLTKRLVDISISISQLEQVAAVEQEILQLQNERARVQDSISELSQASRKPNLSLDQTVSKLARSVDEWLRTLNTQNIYGEAEFDRDFNFSIGEDKLDAFDGSTLIRIVLAFHAAAFELILEEGVPSLDIYVLDTPKQHEIDSQDLDNYFNRLREVVSDTERGQIVFSATEYKMGLGKADALWEPEFGTAEQPRYLG